MSMAARIAPVMKANLRSAVTVKMFAIGRREKRQSRCGHEHNDTGMGDVEHRRSSDWCACASRLASPLADVEGPEHRLQD